MPTTLSLIDPEYQRALNNVMERCAALYIHQARSIYMKSLWEILINTSYKTNNELKIAIEKYCAKLKPGLLHLSDESKAKAYLKKSLRSVQSTFSSYKLLVFERDILLSYIIKLQQSENDLTQTKASKEELERIKNELSISQEMVRKQNDLIDELRDINSRLQLKNTVLTEQVNQLQTTVVEHDKSIQQWSLNFNELVHYLFDTQRKEKTDITEPQLQTSALPLLFHDKKKLSFKLASQATSHDSEPTEESLPEIKLGYTRGQV